MRWLELGMFYAVYWIDAVFNGANKKWQCSKNDVAPLRRGRMAKATGLLKFGAEMRIAARRLAESASDVSAWMMPPAIIDVLVRVQDAANA